MLIIFNIVLEILGALVVTQTEIFSVQNLNFEITVHFHQDTNQIRMVTVFSH